MQTFNLGGVIQTTIGPVPIGNDGIFFAPASDIGTLQAIGCILVQQPAGGTGTTHYVDLDTSLAPQTYILPSDPIDNDVYVLKDAKGMIQTNPVTVIPGTGGVLIDNASQFPNPPSVWINWSAFSFRWSQGQGKWLVQ
jgi:hypothetical protein